MYIAKAKRKENIAEYLLYMWQIEDLIRAYNFDLVSIENEIISQFSLDAEQHQEVVSWYDGLIQQMYNENITEKGHFQFIRNLLDDLISTHNSLLVSDKHISYKKDFEHVLPLCSDLLNKTNNTEKSIIEIFLEALYGVLILRLKKQAISKATEEAITEISTFISILSKKYQDYEKKSNFEF